MSYLTKHLMAGEVVEREARIHWIVYGPALVLLLIAIALFVVVGVGGPAGHAALPAPLVCLGLALVAALSAFVKRRSSEFAVTNKRVVVKLGWLSRRSSEILLRQVEGITVNQGLIGRILDYGTIVVEGTGSDRTPYSGISEPMRFRLAVQEQIEQLSAALNPAGAHPPLPPKNDPYATLLQLHELKEKGILTEEEFKAEKRKILG